MIGSRIIGSVAVKGAKGVCIYLRPVFLGVLAIAIAAGQPAYANNFTITATFDPLVPAELQTVINNAINVYDGLYTDPINVTIYFRFRIPGPMAMVISCRGDQMVSHRVITPSIPTPGTPSSLP